MLNFSVEITVEVEADFTKGGLEFCILMSLGALAPSFKIKVVLVHQYLLGKMYTKVIHILNVEVLKRSY